MIFTLDYIRNYMNKLDKITGFNSSDIELKISKRMTRTYAYNQMQWDDPSDYDNRKLINWRMVYSEAILNCGINEEQMNDIIRHEYCHAWADNGEKISYGHSGKFIECCNKLNCNHSSINYDQIIYKLHDKYIKNNYKNKCEIIKYRNIYNRMTKWCNGAFNNNIRVSAKRNNEFFKVNLIITEKYNEEITRHLFEKYVSSVKDVLSKNKNISIQSEKNEIIEQGYRRIRINYTHNIEYY